MKMIAFWDVVLPSHVEVDRRFKGAYCLHHHHLPDDEGSTYLLNVGQLKRDYTVLHPIKTIKLISIILNVNILNHRIVEFVSAQTVLKIATVCSCETSAPAHNSTQLYNPEGKQREI
jgi:hypothetical protein